MTAELEKLRTQAKSAGKRIGELVQERGTLMAKLRDRDEELRGKTKLLEVGSCESEAGEYAGWTSADPYRMSIMRLYH